MRDAAPLAPDGTTHVALLIDFPVLLRAVRTVDPEAVPNLPAIVQTAMRWGPIYVARAFGAGYDVDEARTAFSAGIDPIFVPPLGGSVPTHTSLVADGLALLRSVPLQALVLCGDDRVLPLAAAARADGLTVSLVAHGCLPGGPALKVAHTSEPATAYARQLTRTEKYRRPSARIA